jgi:hypothetical protein
MLLASSVTRLQFLKKEKRRKIKFFIGLRIRVVGGYITFFMEWGCLVLIVNLWNFIYIISKWLKNSFLFDIVNEVNFSKATVIKIIKQFQLTCMEENNI